MPVSVAVRSVYPFPWACHCSTGRISLKVFAQISSKLQLCWPCSSICSPRMAAWVTLLSCSASLKPSAYSARSLTSLRLFTTRTISSSLCGQLPYTRSYCPVTISLTSPSPPVGGSISFHSWMVPIMVYWLIMARWVSSVPMALLISSIRSLWITLPAESSV